MKLCQRYLSRYCLILVCQNSKSTLSYWTLHKAKYCKQYYSIPQAVDAEDMDIWQTYMNVIDVLDMEAFHGSMSCFYVKRYVTDSCIAYGINWHLYVMAVCHVYKTTSSSMWKNMWHTLNTAAGMFIQLYTTKTYTAILWYICCTWTYG